MVYGRQLILILTFVIICILRGLLGIRIGFRFRVDLMTIQLFKSLVLVLHIHIARHHAAILLLPLSVLPLLTLLGLFFMFFILFTIAINWLVLQLFSHSSWFIIFRFLLIIAHMVCPAYTLSIYNTINDYTR